jgi:hypothetical protein
MNKNWEGVSLCADHGRRHEQDEPADRKSIEELKNQQILLVFSRNAKIMTKPFTPKLNKFDHSLITFVQQLRPRHLGLNVLYIDRDTTTFTLYISKCRL